MPPHPLTNFEMQKFYQNEPKFNGVYSRKSLPKIKDGTYIKDLDQYRSVGTHWIALYVNGSAFYDGTYFGSFGVENIPKEIKKFIGNKVITTNIYGIQAYNSIKCGYLCIRFID